MNDYEKFRPPFCVCGHLWEKHSERFCWVSGCECRSYLVDLPEPLEPVSLQEEIDRS